MDIHSAIDSLWAPKFNRLARHKLQPPSPYSNFHFDSLAYAHDRLVQENPLPSCHCGLSVIAEGTGTTIAAAEARLLAGKTLAMSCCHNLKSSVNLLLWKNPCK